MNKTKILNLLFWIFLIVGVILLIWRIFGQTPSELLVILPFIFTILFKIWSIGDELKEHKIDYNVFKENIKNSFINIKKDINKKKR